MNARAALALGVAAGLAVACSSFTFRRACNADADCPRQGEICFLDGCGDPGQDIVLEVSHAGVAQDQPVLELRATYDPVLEEPPRLEGQVTTSGSGGPAPYAGAVTIRAVGESLLLPGISRVVQPTLALDLGRFSTPASAGQFEVVVVPRDTSLPLLFAGLRSLYPGQVTTVELTVPSPSSLLRISGTLLKTQLLGPLPGMDVQVVAPGSKKALTQKQPVSDSGDFAVLAPPSAVQDGALHLLASPREGTLATGSIIPQRTFLLPMPLAPSYLLELGDFGLTVSVSGVVNGPGGTAVGQARVYLTGTAQGGGTFVSSQGTTTDQGTFVLRALPVALGGRDHTLWVIPPAGSRAGVLVAEAHVTAQGGYLGAYTCPSRVPVHGIVYRPDGKPAAGVQVKTEPLGPVDQAPPPQVSVVATTGLDGAFTLAMDPGLYRLDFDTTDKLPRVSRNLAVRATPLPDGSGWAPIQAPAITLWNGRTVSGTVTGRKPGSEEPVPLANASLRFYRVSFESGGRASYLLAEGVTDQAGGYSVVMPTAPSPPPGTGPAGADGGMPDGG